MYFVEFYDIGLISGDLVPACGDRSVIILDGRESTYKHHGIATAEGLKRGYKGYRLCKGRSFTNYTLTTGVITI